MTIPDPTATPKPEGSEELRTNIARMLQAHRLAGPRSADEDVANAILRLSAARIEEMTRERDKWLAHAKDQCSRKLDYLSRAEAAKRQLAEATVAKQDYIKLLESRLRIKAEDVPFPLSPDEGAIYNQGRMVAIQWALEMLPDAPALAATAKVEELRANLFRHAELLTKNGMPSDINKELIALLREAAAALSPASVAETGRREETNG